MALLTRFRRLVSANVHEWVEQIEDPALLLKETLREMDRQIAATLEASVRATTDEKLVARQIVAHERQIARAAELAERALQRGDESAARSALRERGELRQTLTALQHESTAVADAAQRLRSQLHVLRTQRRSAHARLAALIARQRAAEARRRALQEVPSVAPTSACAEFARLAERVERREAELDALVELTSAAVEPPVTDDGAEIEQELAELKARLAAAGTL